MRPLAVSPALALLSGFLFFAPAHAAPWFEAAWYCHDADARAIAAADVTGDGHLDVVAAASIGLQILPGSGDGSFAAPIDHATGRDGRTLAIADLDADGRSDVVVASPAHSSIDVFMGTPTGLGAPVTHAVGGPPIGVAIADMNQDGHPDVVTGGSPIRIFLGDGAGGLAAPASTGVNGEFAVGDVNGDGWPDLAVIAGTDVRIMVSVSGTSFTPGAVRSFEFEPMVVGLADLDGDGDLDLATGVWGTTVFVFPGDGTGGFQPRRMVETSSHGDPTGFRLGFGEVNGDGIVDLVAAFHVGGDFSNWVEVRSSAGHSTVMSGELVTSIAVGDFDGDGASDIATVGSCGVGLTLNRGNGLGFGAVRFSAGFAAGLASGDFDGDGRTDLAWHFEDYNGDVLVMLDPASPSRSTRTLSPSREPGFIGVLDVDQDGHPDVLTGARFGVEPLHTFVSFHRWDAGDFEAGLEFEAPGDTVPVGDLDGDGFADAVVHGWEFLPGSAGGGFGSPRPIATGGLQVLADFDDDGEDDRATLSPGDGTAQIERGVAGGGFEPTERLGIGETPRALVVGDFDGDGRIDLAVANRGSLESNDGAVTLLRNLTGDAATAVLVRHTNVSAAFDRVTVRWELGGPFALSHVVREGGTMAPIELGVSCSRCDEYSIVDRSVEPGVRYTYRLIADGGRPIGEVDVMVPNRLPAIVLSVTSPATASREIGMTLTLPRSGDAEVSMLDASGRAIARLRVSGEANQPIRHSILKPGALRPGLYWIRVEQSGRVAAKKVVVTS